MNALALYEADQLAADDASNVSVRQAAMSVVDGVVYVIIVDDAGDEDMSQDVNARVYVLRGFESLQAERFECKTVADAFATVAHVMKSRA